MARHPHAEHRLERRNAPSLRNWGEPHLHQTRKMKSNVMVDCGWGRLIFAHTFEDNESIADTLRAEEPGKRDIAFYLRDPHVVISLAPHELFLDPSHTYRLWLDQYRSSRKMVKGFIIRKMQTESDAEAIDAIYSQRQMMTAGKGFIWEQRKSRILTYLVAEDVETGHILGTTMGIDHKQAFDDPENGSSMWCLAVDPQAPHPGIGHALVRQIAEYFLARGRSFMDLSVMHNNKEAIGLYEKLGFQRVPAFCLKRKNAPNEPLFTPAPPEANLNPYAAIIIKEARRRGIAVEVLDEEAGYFELTFGGRTIVCRESLTELTSAIAMSRCDDKRVTRRLLTGAGLRMPAQLNKPSAEEAEAFLKEQQRVVVKPARGEQGAGISVDVRTPESLREAIAAATKVSDDVILEEFVEGQDLRIVVIDNRVGAAAVRLPPRVTGTGTHTIEQLIEKQSRRREAATGGESHIPLDGETRRAVRESGYEMGSILAAGEFLTVRKTANLHTGGTIHDVTDQLHPHLAEVAEKAARVLNIPVVGLDLMVPRVDGDEYAIIEANERPGLANHEPQPLVERFVDFLFPQSVAPHRKEKAKA